MRSFMRTALLSLLAFVPALTSLPASAGAEVTRGPYLQNLREHSIIVAFEGTGFSAPVLAYGLAEPGEWTTPCSCTGGHCVCEPQELAPDSLYLYAVMDGEVALGQPGTFRTAPDWPAPFSFCVYGDNRSDYAAHAIVVSNMVGEEHAFAINTGDLVSDGLVESQWDEFFAIEAEHVRHTPLYPAIGNHDEEEGEAPVFERVFETPGQESASFQVSYYSFDYSNSHFIVLDTFLHVHAWYQCMLEGKLYDNCFTKEQLNWLEIDLAKAANNPGIEHIFVFTHEGPYSSKENRTGSAAMRDLLPLFAGNKVKAIFSGHDHYFEHGTSGNGIEYVISGGGGAPLYEVKQDFLNQLYPHETHLSLSIHNYQVVTVEGPLVTVTTFDVDSQAEIETFTIGEPADCLTAADCAAEEEGSCPGEWACVNYGCVWECAPPPPCETPADCGPAPEGACPGEWDCPPPGQCQWVCAPEAECESDSDCQGKEPLNDCAGGHFQCMDDVCEWVCPPPVEDVVTEPEVTVEPDVAESPGPESAPEVTPAPDGGSPDEPAGEVATQGDAHSADAPTPPPGNLHPMPTSKSGGCAAGPRGEPAAVFLVLFLLLGLGIRRDAS